MCFANPVSNTRAARSLLDYESNAQLRDALQEAVLKNSGTDTGATTATTTSTTTTDSDTSTATLSLDLDPQADWVLSGYNPASTQAQTLDHEYKRLLTLKSYDLLDIGADKTLERITAMTGRMLHCPIAYVGTMDLGRYNILAGKGLGTLKNVHRKGTFCEHVVQSTSDVVVLKDASLNPFMKDNWFVTSENGPKTRFYAAAKLISPEGHVLGTLCVIDPKPRPAGLSMGDKQNLLELAEMVVDYMVERRKGLLLGSSPAQQVVTAAHDLITPVSGIDFVLSSLKDDTNLTEQQHEQLENATRCASVLKDICTDLIHNTAKAAKKACCDGCDDTSSSKNSNPQGPQGGNASANHEDAGIVKMDELVQKISTVLSYHPKQVPLQLSLHPEVPKEIISHDIMLFRSALTLLTRACQVTDKGSIQFRVSLEKNQDQEHEQDDSQSQRPMLLFECQDTGPAVPLEEYPHLFRKPDEYSMHPEQLALHSVAQHMIHVGGNHGYRPSTNPPGNIVWFRVPLFLPETSPSSSLESTSASTSCHDHDNEKDKDKGSSLFPSVLSEQQRRTNCTLQQAGADLFPERTKMALVIEDTLVVRKALSRCLSKLGFQVTQAENGFVGLQKLKEAMYDLVLCDFLMPVLDGVDCVEQFRAWEAKHRPPNFQQYIVGISAHCQTNDIDLGLNAGMNEFRSKPVTIKDLTALQESPAVKAAGRKLDRIMLADGNTSAGNNTGDVHDEPPPMPTFNCLLGAEIHSNYPQLVRAFDPNKWKVVTVYDGNDALELLKIQNWDLVILDDELPRLSGTRCAMRFREWEKCHRINRQRNMVLASAYLIASAAGTVDDETTSVFMPYGLEHTMKKPYDTDACRRFLESIEEKYTSILTGVDIIAH